MSSKRQPLLTLSPSDNICLDPPSNQDGNPQTTPKLPRRERLASFSRLLRNEKFAELSKKSPNTNRVQKSVRDLLSLQSSIDIKISPCREKHRNQFAQPDAKLNDGLLAVNNLPFSPRLLDSSPCGYSPTIKVLSSERSPLYVPNYQKRFLGRGSFGKVSLCSYKGTKFALKIIYPSSLAVGETNLLGIRHPHLVKIFHVSTAGDKTFIFMEFGGNCNLQHILDTKSELDFPRKLSFCVQISSGLQHCHQHGIVHGDVKPANIMVNPRGVCKLGDFGLSFRANSLSLPDDAVGTVGYAAPEVLRGSKPTFLSDVYSFGVLLWQVHTRKTPFAGEHPHVVIYKVVNYEERPRFESSGNPVDLAFMDIAKNCWHAKPFERPTSAETRSKLKELLQNIKDVNKKPLKSD